MAQDAQLKAKFIPFDQLSIHPKNVRQTPTSPDCPELQKLSNTIADHGLLNPLLVEKLDNGYGVIGGGRRLTAIRLLVENADQQDFDTSTKISCRIVAADADITSISFSENTTQLPMCAIDKFEAVDAMTKTGMTIPEIAHRFATTETSIKQFLSLGRVHATIRQAHRDQDISLDALKAFAKHPDPDVQLDVYNGLKENKFSLAPHIIKSRLSETGIALSSALGQFIHTEYTQAGGEVLQGLLEEATLLTNANLVQETLEKKLNDIADAKCTELGMAWSIGMIDGDYNDLSKYGQIYKKALELDDETQKTVDALTADLTVNFVPVPGQWGTLPLSMKGAPNGTTSKNIYRRV